MTATYTQDPVTTICTVLRLVWVGNMDPARTYLTRMTPDELRAAKTVLVRTACLVETVLYQPLEDVARAVLLPDSLPAGVGGFPVDGVHTELVDGTPLARWVK